MSTAQTPTHHRGIVKQALSGDVVIIRGQPKGGPPPEKTLNFSNITAPKLARRANPQQESSSESKDEPWAWEAREFVRRKLVGKEIYFIIEGKLPSGREYGVVYLGKDTTGENITESLVTEGLAEVRRIGKLAEEQQKLIELEDGAKNAKRGKWGDSPQLHVRDIKWNIDQPRNFVDSFHNKPIKAVIEHVRDGSTVRGFLLPDFYHITLMISGVRCPMIRQGMPDEGSQPEPYAEEAKYFTESRLLQRDVEIILESINNANFVGTVLHPNGNIAELLLKEGFARCVDWSMGFVTGGPEKLRAAEKVAKEKRSRLWKDYAPSGPQVTGKDKEFSGTVIEIANADALIIKAHNQPARKIFLASVRPPRLPDNQQAEDKKEDGKDKKQFRPLYDIPYMYEAREFLRKKLIGKSVHVTVDYIQPAAITSTLPERVCCTVTIGGQNVAEALVSKGLATVVRYRQDDDHRSSHYDELLAAETKAQKTGMGINSKADKPIHRVADISTEHGRAKQFLPFLQRAGRTEAVVEFVASGSRFRVFVPKETCIITFLLAGISCPRPTRPGPGGSSQIEGEPWGEDAMNFTKEMCMQREVEIEVESMDKGGNFIGWLYIDKKNLSLLLVENSLAAVHFTAERSPYYNALCAAESAAKAKKQKVWANFVETRDDEIKTDQLERTVNYKKVVVTDVTSELQFYAQHVDQGPKLETLMEQLRQEFIDHPPLEGAFSPRRGDICAAKFTDNLWYRGKVEKTSGNNVNIFYMDYGNREVTTAIKLAQLPTAFQHITGFAHQYALACVQLPTDTDYREEAVRAFSSDTDERTLELNEEYKTSGLSYVTLRLADSKEDLARGLISDGLLMVEMRKEKHLQQLVNDYKSAQDAAKKSRLNIWRYGDFTEDDAKEFGYQR